jgi:hypothetical protein
MEGETAVEMVAGFVSRGRHRRYWIVVYCSMKLRDPTNLVGSVVTKSRCTLVSSNHALMDQCLVSETRPMLHACRLLPITRD